MVFAFWSFAFFLFLFKIFFLSKVLGFFLASCLLVTSTFLCFGLNHSILFFLLLCLFSLIQNMQVLHYDKNIIKAGMEIIID